MFRLIVQLASSVRAVLQYAPTNRFLRQLHSRRGVVSIVAAMLAGVAYLFAAAICTVLLDGGAPGWLNILVVLFLWNGAKLALNGLIMATVLVRSGLRSVRSRQARPPRAVVGQASEPRYLR
ncbi:MAG: sulfate permease [Dehalococcoidia bacterium]